MSRSLSSKFISDLQAEDILGKILSYVKNDNTLDIEIRENYINIYYRGGNILKVTEKGKSYIYDYDKDYLKGSVLPCVNTLSQYKSNRDWDNFFPMMKQAMDFYFSKHAKEEREYQQLVVRENNYSSIANSTDYFIIDIEYDNHAHARFDLIAIEWPSTSSDRKLPKKPRLIVIEMKYGDGALSGSAGIKKHCDDFNKFVSSPKELEDFKNEMLSVFSQKRELGLIPCLSSSKNSNKIENFDGDIELAFLIANHDPASSKLKKELSSCGNISAKFIVSNFMGYGIYNHAIYDQSTFEKIYKRQIYEI